MPGKSSARAMRWSTDAPPGRCHLWVERMGTPQKRQSGSARQTPPISAQLISWRVSWRMAPAWGGLGLGSLRQFPSVVPLFPKRKHWLSIFPFCPVFSLRRAHGHAFWNRALSALPLGTPWPPFPELQDPRLMVPMTQKCCEIPVPSLSLGP